MQVLPVPALLWLVELQTLIVAVLKHDGPEIKADVACSPTQLIDLFLLKNSQHREAPPE